MRIGGESGWASASLQHAIKGGSMRAVMHMQVHNHPSKTTFHQPPDAEKAAPPGSAAGLPNADNGSFTEQSSMLINPLSATRTPRHRNTCLLQNNMAHITPVCTVQ